MLLSLRCCNCNSNKFVRYKRSLQNYKYPTVTVHYQRRSSSYKNLNSSNNVGFKPEIGLYSPTGTAANQKVLRIPLNTISSSICKALGRDCLGNASSGILKTISNDLHNTNFHEKIPGPTSSNTEKFTAHKILAKIR